MADNEEASLVEQALHAVRAGNAGSWPTVAGYLAEEVERLREQLREDIRQAGRKIEAYEAGADASPRDEGTQATAGQLWHSLLRSDENRRLGLLEGLLANTEQSRECFTQDHRGQIEMMSFDLQDVQARLSATFGFETPQSLHALTVATQALRNIMVMGIASRVVEEADVEIAEEMRAAREADSVKVIDDAFERAGIDITARCEYEWPNDDAKNPCSSHFCGLINPMHAQAHECEQRCGATLSHEDAERLATQ